MKSSRERMLPVPFDLEIPATGEIIVDVESLVRGVMAAEGWTKYLEEMDNAELLGTLLGDAVYLSGRYWPFDRETGERFGDTLEPRPWLFQRLRFKARDWRKGYERHRVTGDRDGDGGLGSRTRSAGLGGGQSGGAPDQAPGDRGDSGLAVLRKRFLEGRDRALIREIEALGLSAPTRARDGAQDADPGAPPRRRRIAA